MGLREFKKQKTRVELIDAALELFLSKGYEHTTVDEIAAAVGVSQRTFFRYFAGKEQAALAVPRESEDELAEALRTRPATEGPITAMGNAMRQLIDEISHSDDSDVERYVKGHLLISQTPDLMAENLRCGNEMEQRLVKVLAERMGTDPATDLRPSMIIGATIGSVRLSFDLSELTPSREILVAIAEHVTQMADLAESAFRPEWNAPRI